MKLAYLEARAGRVLRIAIIIQAPGRMRGRTGQTVFTTHGLSRINALPTLPARADDTPNAPSPTPIRPIFSRFTSTTR
jgi:hypothetical protein